MKTLKIMTGIISLSIACTFTSGCFLALAGGAGYAVGEHETKQEKQKKEEEKKTPSATTKIPTHATVKNQKTATNTPSKTTTTAES